MPPDDLGVALAVLVRDGDSEIASTAVTSLKDMPRAVLEGLMSNEKLSGPILDVYTHTFSDDARLLQRLVANRSTFDESVRWMARKLKGTILDIIASNQVRVVREPEIIVALVKNAATPTPLLARVLETAIRNGVDTTRIPGFKQLAEAFFGDTSSMSGQEAPEEPTVEPAEVEAAPEPEPVVEVVETTPEEEALQDLLSGAEVAAEPTPTRAEKPKEEEEEPKEERRKPLFKQIEDMNVPQKVRLALMGDASARKILVRDKVRVVAEAVMKSPKITEKEISAFVVDKAISGEIIRLIAKSREYTRNYTIMVALIYNPKTPPPQAVGFIRNLRRKDLQNLLRAKGVPSYINRAARQVKEKRGDN